MAGRGGLEQGQQGLGLAGGGYNERVGALDLGVPIKGQLTVSQELREIQACPVGVFEEEYLSVVMNSGGLRAGGPLTSSLLRKMTFE